MDHDDPIAAKRLQKASREKVRRDRLNEQFIELGKSIDADRPKNDKATILTDTIQLLKGLTDEVDKLKAEHGVLSEESSELIQVKNDLKEEKEALKSDIEKLNAQCRQRLGPACPWLVMDHSLLPHPPSYSYPMPYSYPTLQPYPFFGSPIPGMYPNPCSTFIPYVNCNTPAEQKSTQHPSSSCHPGSRALVSGEGPRTSCDKDRENQIDKHDDSDGVGTNLELKTPGSSTEEEASSVENKAKKPLPNKSAPVGGSSSSCSSSHSVQDSSSNSAVAGGNTND